MAARPAAKRRLEGQAGPTLGLRERKKQKTREAIQRVAVRLFLKQGYEETTIEEIAAAVEISPSTFFNYFPTKEDVVMLDTYDPMTMDLFRKGPKNEPVSAAFRRVLGVLAGILEQDRELILTRSRLMLEVPALRGRVWDEMERTQQFLSALLAQRSGRDPDDFQLRVTVRVLISAAYEAVYQWMRGGGRERLADLLNRAMDVVDGNARLDALPSRRSRSSRTERP